MWVTLATIQVETACGQLSEVRPLARTSQGTMLFGRDELLQSLRVTQRVLLVGPPGVGKSALALALDPTLCVDASALHTPEELALAICAEAGMHSVRGTEPVVPLAEAAGMALAQMADALVLLDGIDRLADSLESMLAAWVQRAPRLRIVATSCKRPARLRSLAVVEVPPLAVADARDMFLGRATALRPGLESPTHVITELVKDLDCLPLAIELAAARIDVLSPTELRERLSVRFDVLRARGDAVSSLQHAVETSVALLTTSTQRMFAQLSVYRTPFGLAQAEGIVGADGSRVLDALSELLGASLLERSDSPDGELRFAFLETVRSFAEGLLDSDPMLAQEARDAHARQCVARMQFEAPASARKMLADLDAAFAFANGRDARLACDLVLGIDELVSRTGPFAPHLQRLTLAIETAGNVETRARLLLRRGRTRFDAGQSSEALADVSESQELARQAGVTELDDEAARVVSMIMHWSARFDEGLELLDGQESHARNADQVMLCVGTLLYGRGDVARAAECFERARGLAQAKGDVHTEGACAGLVALMAHDQGDRDKARAGFWGALAALEQAGNRYFGAMVRNWHGQLLLEEGDLPGAEAEIAAAVQVLDEMGDQRFLGAALGYLGIVAQLRGDLPRAQALLGRCVELSRKGSDHYRLRHFLAHLARVQALAGDQPGAQLSFAAAKDGAERGNPNLMPVIDLLAASVGLGDIHAAKQSAEARFGYSSDVRVAQRMADDTGAQAAPSVTALHADMEGTWFQSAGAARVNLGRRKPLVRILKQLVDFRHRAPGRAATSQELLATGWPGERVEHGSGMHRVHVAIATLRKLGLPGLISDGGGYRLSETVILDLHREGDSQ